MAFVYYDREGFKISRERWSEFGNDDDYCTVRAFDNGAVKVTLVWLGRVDTLKDQWDFMYPIFRLNVANYNSNGELVADPVDDGKTFRLEREGIEAYEAFVAKWTESYLDDDGELVEVDNDIAPPPPPNPDAPASDVASVKGVEIDDVGAW